MERLTEQAYLVLLALAEQPRHGYAVIQVVRDLTDGRVVLRPGTLYGVLDRLVRSGLAAPDRQEVVGGRLRRYYVLTIGGAEAVQGETARLQSLARAGRRALRPRTLG